MAKYTKSNVKISLSLIVVKKLKTENFFILSR